MVTVWVRAPVMLASRTPSISCSAGTSTRSSRSASCCGSPSEVAASVTAGRSSVLPATTVGSTPSGSWLLIRSTARCILPTTSSVAVPKSNEACTVAMLSWEVELTVVSPATPRSASSIGRLTCCSTTSAEAPW